MLGRPAFQRTHGHLYVNLQPLKWLNLHSCFSFGDAIYYDPVDPFLGHRTQLHVNCTLQPNKNLNLFAEHVISRFRRPETGEKVYDQGIWRGRLTYQFNSKLFVRGLVQYDSFYQRVLGDFLASFTYIPGTVLYLGYGSLNESQSWTDNALAARRHRRPLLPDAPEPLFQGQLPLPVLSQANLLHWQLSYYHGSRALFSAEIKPIGGSECLENM